ncbi:hypothetical protein J7E83_12435 [Arthrobacter sp. ISL-48]|uniref:hypothetical protein n=1 Tax=Arthrobacter sp. ISL-48 TaxID=2819110 RepID=UPI001BEC3E98|nr:hypothetical protein [Arthrobacter sp. ISL-48]MBT2532913.1 hypothetical protein [Arthrobacter sp. ISL-48]
MNFLVGDIVTNARSCLDMSIDSIWKNYNLDRKGVVVQFPLEDNYQAKLARDMRFRKFIGRLDHRFVRVIEQSQPHYSGGSLDIPRNITALFISHLSNANKHRNITPVVMHFSSSIVGTRANMGMKLHKIVDRLHSGAPLRFVLSYDPNRNRESDIRRYLTVAAERPRSSPLIIGITQKLVIDRQSIPLSPLHVPEREFNIPAGFDELLNNVPTYIALTLRNLNRVHDAVQAGDDDVFLDFNAGL